MPSIENWLKIFDGTNSPHTSSAQTLTNKLMYNIYKFTPAVQLFYVQYTTPMIIEKWNLYIESTVYIDSNWP